MLLFSQKMEETHHFIKPEISSPKIQIDLDSECADESIHHDLILTVRSQLDQLEQLSGQIHFLLSDLNNTLKK